MPRTNINDISHYKKRLESIARFEDAIFHCVCISLEPFKLLDSNYTTLENYSVELRFIEFFTDTNDNFIKKYRAKYPRYSFKIYKDVHRPMPKYIRDKIKTFSLEDVLFRDKLRDHNLKKLLG